MTGAARGIGRGIAGALAQHGADVAIVDGGPLADQVPRIQFMPPYRNMIDP